MKLCYCCIFFLERARASGYSFKFVLYCGKDPEDIARDDLLLGLRVLLNMLDCIEKPENHCVYFDNFFTSRDLLIHLGNLGFRATGTVRENEVGDCPLFDRNGEVLFVRWHDNRCVTIGTNFDQAEPLGAATRYSRQASKETQVLQPAVLKSYNAYMGGVDDHDWIVGKYAMNLLDFRRAVTVTYLKLDTGRPNIGRPMEYPSSQLRVIPDIRSDGIGHMIDKRRMQRRCFSMVYDTVRSQCPILRTAIISGCINILWLFLYLLWFIHYVHYNKRIKDSI
ncbi:piggyBac transposable element-derived protein 3-like [Schistocerca americana]|uniref:piggyBac transposable element-derived protein 3-like n=1 Tax=Schistocerca americana TaxID=7009 RepID=UPI001F4FFA32|nr:piggyBac transposable element-derived protein 3-like [Schistocerca americana]